MDWTEHIGQNLVKIIADVCFSFFVFSVLIFTVIAITYQPPDPWLQSSKALTKVFSSVENATFQPDESILKTGEDLVSIPPSIPPLNLNESQKLSPLSPSNCFNNASQTINCLDPRVLSSVKAFNRGIFKSIAFLEYQRPVNGSKPNECDVAWRFRNKKERSWRNYRDFRRYSLQLTDDCTVKVTAAGRWHSGKNARFSPRKPISVTPHPTDTEINDTVPTIGPGANFIRSKYLYYSRGGDHCKSMNHYLWSFLCGLAEAQYLNRTFIVDLNVCLSASYNPSNIDQEGKDLRYYFDFEHLKEVASVVEELQFLKGWKITDRSLKKRVSVRKVATYKVTPMQLKRDKSTVVWRQFDTPEPENYWYRVCEGPASKHLQRPWHAIWKSKHLMNIVSAISGRLNWDFDAVHVVRGQKAENRNLWPHLDEDTSPDALLTKLKHIVMPWRTLYIATNEPYYNYFDKLRSQFKIYLLDDFRDLWDVNSEWYNVTMALNDGRPVEFDGYMRVEVDTEVLYRARKRVETFNNLTLDCKDGLGTC